MRSISKLILSFLILVVGFLIGRAFTPAVTQSWYLSLNQPLWKPPDYVFGPVWVVLYCTIAISLWLYWKTPVENKKSGYISFFIQMILNFSWTPIFFGMHQLFLAMIVSVCLIISLVVMMHLFRKVKPASCWILVPYLLWLCLALSINIYLVIYN